MTNKKKPISCPELNLGVRYLLQYKSIWLEVESFFCPKRKSLMNQPHPTDFPKLCSTYYPSQFPLLPAKTLESSGLSEPAVRLLRTDREFTAPLTKLMHSGPFRFNVNCPEGQE